MYQTRSTLGTGILMLVMVGLLGIGGLSVLVGPLQGGVRTPARSQTSSTWLEGHNAQVSDKLYIADHAKKHGEAAWMIYSMLLAGKCVADMTYCGGSALEKMHVCVDPETGLVGAVLQFGAEITTGFYEGSTGYWERRIVREKWEVCSDD